MKHHPRRLIDEMPMIGGRDNGAPGERDHHPGNDGTFVLDPDGNNIEAVHHGPAQRSAASVVVTPRD